MDQTDSEVIVVGAGPTGLMLAGELGLAGISTIVVERLTEPTRQSRALGFSVRTVEEFSQRGLRPRFGDIGLIPVGHFGGLPLDFRVIEGGSFGVRGVPQARTESILAGWAGELGARILRGFDVIAIEPDEHGVDVDVATPGGRRRLRARYVVGCDGGRSTVRRLAGIDFPGTEPTLEMWTADVGGVRLRLRPSGENGRGGMVLVLPVGPDVTRVVVRERNAPVRQTQDPPTFEQVADSFERITGEDIHHGTPLWTSCFTDSSRQATEYRRGRVFLAGDAAHIHMPIGAQGISAGLGDAVNLGWKLAAEIHGHAPPGLLDTYHTERQPVAARIITNTLAQRDLYLSGEEMQPLRDVFAELMTYLDVQRHLAGMITGLDIRYDVGAGDDPLLGRRVPDLDLVVDDLPTSVYELLATGRALLLDLRDDPRVRQAAGPWADRVATVTARAAGPGSPYRGLLVRPDGYVAWVASGGEPDLDDLTTTLTRWFGQLDDGIPAQPALVNAPLDYMRGVPL
ncbi:MAG TPA: FAD-dependent monooxygenase [Mycobacteriales bacterium]|nr:FAD-dependent monooxygenase [Mycobacteriales bacterium]